MKTSLKNLLFVYLILSPVLLHSQELKPKANWQNLDLKDDGVFGISTEKMYSELLKDKPHQPVIVAVIDGGVDVNHEDLKPIIWTNPKEVPGNGKDDDKNGFIDDAHGWNFFGTMSKGDEEFQISKLAKQVNKYKGKFVNADSSTLSKKDLSAFREYSDLRKEFEVKMLPERSILKGVQANLILLGQMLKKIEKPNPTIDDFKNYISRSEEELKLQKNLVDGLKIFPDYVAYKKLNLERAIDHYKMEIAYYENQDYDLTTGGPTAYHGTHLAGIIAAVRDNNIGIKGVADDAKIMVVRTIPGLNPTGDVSQEMTMTLMAGSEGNEHHKTIAKSIHYAVDNGAKVINMSFGQSWAMNAGVMEEAVKYAISKDVLIIHASGNEGLDLDQKVVFPNRKTKEGEAIAKGWIEVGASGWKNDDKLAGNFSNFGKTSVDVFAPGIDILSTAPRNRYLEDTGTSMAAPVVTGLAAVIREYYPKLTALQVKEIIMKSVVKEDALKDKSISGGVVNAYNALKLAQIY